MSENSSIGTIQSGEVAGGISGVIFPLARSNLGVRDIFKVCKSQLLILILWVYLLPLPRVSFAGLLVPLSTNHSGWEVERSDWSSIWSIPDTISSSNIQATSSQIVRSLSGRVPLSIWFSRRSKDTLLDIRHVLTGLISFKWKASLEGRPFRLMPRNR